MQMESLGNHFKKGLTSLAVLSLLKRDSMYGYQLVLAMEELSNGQFVLQEGTLYPILYRLQENGLIDSERILVGKRMTRVYYTITPAGVAYLDTIRKEFEAITEGFQMLLDYSESPKAEDDDRLKNLSRKRRGRRTAAAAE